VARANQIERHQLTHDAEPDESNGHVRRNYPIIDLLQCRFPQE
jgi:hypothetical protein